MQAPTWTGRLEAGRFKLILVAALAAAALILGMALAGNQSSSDQAAIVSRAATGDVRPTPNTRFLERNILPGDRGIYMVTSLREHRFLEWNILPGDDAPFVPPDGERGTRH